MLSYGKVREGVAAAGSWAVWVEVFSRSWMKLLVASGLTYKRARIVTSNISAIISECRCAVAKVKGMKEQSKRAPQGSG
jgi:hypothetical protein